MSNDFDQVIWVVVSQDLQIEKVQDEIGKTIGFLDEAWKHKRIDEKAADIFNILCKKKFALLLDNIWKWFDLTRIGVPLPTQRNGSKIIFTTRLIDVCFQMEAHKKIKVECLQQAEALKLFLDKVGAETLDRHPHIRKLAETMADECGGLPLALITIGRPMSSKRTPGEWKYAMKALRQSAASVFPGIGKKMFPQLKFSYDCLPDEKVRSCFLYCCLFPSGFPIRKSELIHCWIGEGLLDQHTDLSSVRNQGEYILGSLIDACLLEDIRSDIVKMHDVIRDMALWIASESEMDKFCVKAGMHLKEQPVAETWEDVRRVSLMGNQIESLTQISVCPNLRTLFLGKNELKVIINDFFNFMPKLKVLNLSFNINLEELPVGIAQLVSLEHLDLSYTGLKTLPVELKVLENLKYLNIEHTLDLKTIPPQLISNLSKLKVLKMVGSGYEWLVEEVERLAYLNVLTISIESLSLLERAMKSYKFQTCNVEAVILKLFKGSRSLSISALADIQPLDVLVVYDCEDLEEVKIEHEEIVSAGCFRSVTRRADGKFERVFGAGGFRSAKTAETEEDIQACAAIPEAEGRDNKRMPPVEEASAEHREWKGTEDCDTRRGGMVGKCRMGG
ncbi:hypothetical protein F3Y22_tig00110893pilonHSYRG01286 [Hibiscus syriacus]|uniref:Uncharacterized protein n=1 Tax=Hibiscus syriacus TaxID=106335 RepID=A0A6A2ZHQ4_HIBSY|nr:hypothetical protein F3Y22_tig00110893pilonHSYRG01286 [Hibiscus syriacus]